MLIRRGGSIRSQALRETLPVLVLSMV